MTRELGVIDRKCSATTRTPRGTYRSSEEPEREKRILGHSNADHTVEISCSAGPATQRDTNPSRRASMRNGRLAMLKTSAISTDNPLRDKWTHPGEASFVDC